MAKIMVMVKKLLVVALCAIAAGAAVAVGAALTDSDRLAEVSVEPLDGETRRYTPRFENIAQKIGLPDTIKGVECDANAAAASWINLDHKGPPELILGSYRGWNVIWSVTPDKAEPVANLGKIASATGFSVADYDNDGWDDLLVATQRGPRLFHNQQGTLRDVTSSSGLKAHELGMMGAWGDFNRDGLLDLALTQGNNCTSDKSGGGFHFGVLRFYLQEAPGKFASADNLLSFPPRPALGMAVSWTDLNNDGWLDLYMSNDNIGGVQNQAWRNDRGRRLVPGFKSSEIEINSMGAGLGDLNRDGRIDLAISNIQPINTLTNTPKKFERTRLSTASYASLPVTWGLIIEDFNNDGWEDIWSAAGGIEGESTRFPQIFFLNRGKTRQLTDVGRAAGLGGQWRGRSPATIDLNNDGLLDVAMAGLNDKPALFINRGAKVKGGWLQVRLEGNPQLNSPRSACGARAWLQVGRTEWMREVECGSEGFLSTSDRMLHFGTGRAQGPATLKIRWPGGQVERHKVSLNRSYRFLQVPQ